MKSKFKRILMAVFLITAIISCSFMQVSFAYSIMQSVEDDFEAYAEEADIVSFTAINSKTIPNDGRMTPASGYTWAERYNSDSLETKGFEPVYNADVDGMVGSLYNYDTGQFYRVSSTAISGCKDNSIVLSGRFCIPDVSGIGGFDFGIVPNERYSSKVFESFCTLVSINSNGALYKSVKDSSATWGASNELVEGIVIESNVWYNVAFIVESSASRNYHGRIFTDDGAVDVCIDEGYIAEPASNGDTSGDKLRMGAKLGKVSGASNANKVLLDDLYMCTTDFSYSLGVPADINPHTEQTGADELAITFSNTVFIADVFSVYNILIENENSSFNPLSVEYITDEHKLVMELPDNLLPDTEYTISFTDISDVFGNKLTDIHYKTEPPSFKVRNVSFQIDGADTSALDQGAVTCFVNVANDLSEDVELSVVMALYKDGVLIALSCGNTETIGHNSSAILSNTLDCAMTDNEGEYVLITYLWDSFDGGCAMANPRRLDSLGITEIMQ